MSWLQQHAEPLKIDGDDEKLFCSIQQDEQGLIKYNFVETKIVSGVKTLPFSSGSLKFQQWKRFPGLMKGGKVFVNLGQLILLL